MAPPFSADPQPSPRAEERRTTRRQSPAKGNKGIAALIPSAESDPVSTKTVKSRICREFPQDTMPFAGSLGPPHLSLPAAGAPDTIRLRPSQRMDQARLSALPGLWSGLTGPLPGKATMARTAVTPLCLKSRSDGRHLNAEGAKRAPSRLTRKSFGATSGRDAPCGDAMRRQRATPPARPRSL